MEFKENYHVESKPFAAGSEVTMVLRKLRNRLLLVEYGEREVALKKT